MLAATALPFLLSLATAPLAAPAALAGDSRGSTYGASESLRTAKPKPKGEEPEAVYTAPTGTIESGELPPPILPDYDGEEAGAAAAIDPGAYQPDTIPDGGAPLAAGDAATGGMPTAIESGNVPAVGSVDIGGLPPVMGIEGGLPHQLWSGTTVEEVEAILGTLDIPPRSAALHSLWRRLLTTAAEAPAGGRSPSHFLALRVAGLQRSGLFGEASAVLAGGQGGPADSMLLTAKARAELGLGETEAACASMKQVKLASAQLPKSVRNDALLLSAYCISKDKNPEHASLAAEVARDQGVEQGVALAVLDSIAETKTPRIPKGARIDLIDYKFLGLLGPKASARVLQQAGPDVLVAIANDATAGEETRLAAAEAAARLNAIDTAGLMRAYENAEFDLDLLQAPLSAPLQGAAKRALIYQAAMSATDPRQRLDLARHLLDGAGRDGIYLPMAQLLAAVVGQVPPSQEIAWFGESAIEAYCAAGNYELAMRWATSSGDLMHWLPIIDIADAAGSVPHGSSLRVAEDLVQANALAPESVERLATVLDALDYNVPISIWDAAQRAPKTDKGHLPATGVLSQLQAAAAQQSYGKTILLAIAALGPDGGEGAHLLSLGDAIRALKATGLEPDARRLGFEALFAAWPRRGNG